MAKQVTMPQMGADMTEGTIAKWLKKPGDAVDRGEPIAEIETDKVTIEIESFDRGTIKQLLVEEGATAPVGTVIALIDDGSGDEDEGEAEVAVELPPGAATS
ncbi:MAG TPA: biotin/lipoyl-containing protein, partial [Herpetosiphonaceae bacterium]